MGAKYILTEEDDELADQKVDSYVVESHQANPVDEAKADKTTCPELTLLGKLRLQELLNLQIETKE